MSTTFLNTLCSTIAMKYHISGESISYGTHFPLNRNTTVGDIINKVPNCERRNIFN